MKKVNDIEARGDEALAYLTSSDESAASLKHEVDVAEANYQAILDVLFLHSEMGSVEAKKADARTNERAENARLAYFEAQRKYDAMANRRKSEALVMDWCRSLYSNYRQGK